MPKDLTEYWRQAKDRLEETTDEPYEISAIVLAELDAERWEPPRDHLYRLAYDQCRKALQTEMHVDAFGRRTRLNLCVTVKQKSLWRVRHSASREFKQKFVDEQAQRVVQDRDALAELVKSLNGELPKGQMPLQLVFPWDGASRETG